MSDGVVTRQLAERSSRSWTLKSLFMAFSLVALLASNVASLVNSGAHDLMDSALLRILLIGG